MGGYYGMAVLAGVALLLTTGQCVGCRGTDGHAGVSGDPGRDGYPGPKGEKGEPAVMNNGPVDDGVLLSLKGEKGNQSPQGVMGPKGFRGYLGRPGDPGALGRSGPEGKSIGHGGQLSAQQGHSAFSVIRTDTSYPPVGQGGQVVTFQKAVVNTLQDFNTATGHFVCRVPGVYYFTFHSVAKVSVCLRIASEALVNKLGFCDYNRNADQVLSGGVVLTLRARQQVWLESFQDNQRDAEKRDSQEKQIIFNGFLLFSNPE